MIILSLMFVHCKKLDFQNTPSPQQTETDSLSPVLQKFFNTSKVSNPVIKGIAKKIYRQEKEKPFVEKFVKYAGYPVWDKNIILNYRPIKADTLHREGKDFSTVAFIPFALTRDSTVNAIMKVRITPNDTTFKMIYRWQYTKFGYKEIEKSNSAKQIALFFMKMENLTFNHEYYKINDSLLLKGDSSTGIVRQLRILPENKLQDNQYQYYVKYTICYEIWVQDPPPIPVYTVKSEIVPCHCHVEQRCTDFYDWVDLGDGGGIPPGTPPDSGGGGDNDGGWSDNPCDSSGIEVPATRQQPPCDVPPAWEPDPEPPVLPQRDANGYLYSRIATLQAILDSFPQALLPCDSLNIMPLEQYGSMWQNVAQFTPSQYVLDRIDSIRNVAPNWIVDNFNIQSLEDASGGIVNCDFFPVRITQMPAGFTPESLLEYFRTRINSFIDPNLGMSFGPYWDYGAGAGLFIDTAKYMAPYEGSVGSLWHLDLGSLPGADGSVIESGYTRYNSGGYQTHYFTVSTMETPLDYEHPVSGNRRFGIYSDPDHPGEFVFYTMGVDRAWDLIFDKGNNLFRGFKSADSLWTSLQNGMIQFIQDNNGSASFYSNHNSIARPHWTDVEKYLKGDFDFTELKRRLGC